MKKIAIAITSIALAVITTSFISYKNFTVKKVNKNINVEIYKEVSYNSPVYADAYATLNITVIKVCGNKRDTAFTQNSTTMQLKNFPSFDKPFISKIAVSNVNDIEEKLEVYYTLTYSTKGSRLIFSDVRTIGKSEQSGNVSIKI